MLSESTPNSEERERLIAVVARTFAGWNEDTEDGDLTAHWEKVNATCLREAAKIVDAVLAAGYRPLLATSAGVTRMLVTDLRNVEAHDRADQLAHRAADLIESLTAQLAASNVNLSREMRARDGLQAKLDDTIAALATTGGETEWEWMVRSTLKKLGRTWESGVTDEETARVIARGHTGPPADIDRVLMRRRPAGPWVPVDPTSPETTDSGGMQ